MPPTFLSASDASTIFTALEVSDPALSMDALQRMAQHVGFVVLFVGSDLASSCSRAKLEVARRVVEHNSSAGGLGDGRMLLLSGECAAHVIHREVEHAFDTLVLIPKLYATAWSCSLPGTFGDIERALREIVSEDLAVGFFPATRPPPDEAHAAHAEVLMELTLLRSKHVRARSEDGDATSSELAALRDEFLAMFNGDLRRGRIEHYCWEDGCCDGHRREVAVGRIVGVAMRAFFEGMGVALPSATRWYTFSPHLARQCGALMAHRLLPRVLARAFRVQSPETVGGEAGENFHAVANQRRAASLEFMEDLPRAGQCLGLALACCVPLDHLSLRLQHLDHAGGGLRDMADASPAGPLIGCQAHLWSLINPWAAGVGPSDHLD